jgi:hypothetical protein
MGVPPNGVAPSSFGRLGNPRCLQSEPPEAVLAEIKEAIATGNELGHALWRLRPRPHIREPADNTQPLEKF